MKLTPLHISLITCLLLLSCEKYRQPIIENTDILLISKVIIGSEIYMEYTYNEVNLLAEEKSKFHYTKHNYNDNNQLISSDFYWDISMASSDSRVIEAAMNRKEWVSPENTPKNVAHEFEYASNGELIRKTYIRTSDNYPDIVEFQYKDDKITRSTGYYKNAKSGYNDYYYDERGNLSKQVKYTVLSSGITELTTTTEYEFDNMKNPYQAFKRLTTPGKYTNPNNIIKEIYTIHFEVDPWTQKIQVTDYSYEYNDMGYPIMVNDEVEYVYR
jgi:hypothetical protein